LSANRAREKIVTWGWEGDGILAWLGAWDELAEFVERQNKPTVDFSLRRPHLHFPRVIEDHAHAAQLVADHFLSRGFTRFVFYSDAANWSYDELEATDPLNQDLIVNAAALRFEAPAKAILTALEWKQAVPVKARGIVTLARPPPIDWN
jgi:hypothetical protein